MCAADTTAVLGLKVGTVDGPTRLNVRATSGRVGLVGLAAVASPVWTTGRKPWLCAAEETAVLRVPDEGIAGVV